MNSLNKPETPTVTLAICDKYVAKLFKTAQQYSNSLRGEFAPSPEAVKDWRKNLDLLHKTITPLNSAIDKLASSPEADSPDWRLGLLNEINISMGDAIFQMMPRHDVSSTETLSQGASSLRRAVAGLQIWINHSGFLGKSKLSVPSATLANETDSFDEGKLKAFLEKCFHEMSDLAREKSNSQETNILTRKCMASRKLYLVGYFICCVRPSLWGSHEQEEFKNLHLQMVANMAGPNHYRASVKRRLDLAQESEILFPQDAKTAA